MPIRPLRSTVALAALWSACAMTAWAAPPEAGSDPVLTLLQERGLLPGEVSQPGLMREIRDMGDRASDLVISAMNFIGVRYRRGGNSADEGFDCSGFTRHIFQDALGLVLPRRADEQAHASGVHSITRSELRPGDLVFFNTLKRTFSHVGIYVGEGKFIHSPRAGGQVRLEDMQQRYWDRRFTGARRVDALAALGHTPETPTP
jgi:cell wall-associated NlpC family hydrolase